MKQKPPPTNEKGHAPLAAPLEVWVQKEDVAFHPYKEGGAISTSDKNMCFLNLNDMEQVVSPLFFGKFRESPLSLQP